MKKSLRRKLIMSAVAVGAAAIATTSSTYAWFVSNATVKTAEITGSVTSSKANLQISNQQSGTFGVTAAPTYNNTALKPITKVADGAFGAYKNIKNEDLTSNAESEGFIEFTLYFKATSLEAGKTYNLVLKQSTAAETTSPTHTALIKQAADQKKGYTGFNAGDDITEDVTKSLYLSAKTDASTSVNIPFNTAAATYDALAYYNTVTGTTDAKASTVSVYKQEGTATALTAEGLNCVLKSFTAANLTATGGVFSVDFQIWMDGADDACFDAVASHQWKTALNFELVEQQ